MHADDPNSTGPNAFPAAAATPAEVARRAFGWIIGNLEGFDPFARQRSYEIRRGQRVGELAILLKTHVGLTGDRDSDGVRRILALLQAVPRHRAFSDRLLRYPGELILFAQLQACFRALGIPAPAERAALERALAAGYLGHTERLPHRMMDVASCLEGCGFAERFPSLPELYEQSILSPVPEAVHLNEDAVYAITHVLMFLYDFGLRDGLAVPAAQRAPLARCLAALMVAAGHEHHWDLLAELLVSWDCVGLPQGEVYHRAWEALAAVQRDDGAVPGPEWAQRQHDAAPAAKAPAEAERFDFAHHYHTTLVVTIAGALHEKRRRAPIVTPIAPDAGAAGPAEAFADPEIRLRRIAAIGHADRWLETVLARLIAGATAAPEALCRCLLGAWICRSRDGAPALDLVMISGVVGERLAGVGGAAPPDWSAVPPALQLVAAAILEACAVVVPALNGRDGIVRQAAAALDEPTAAAADDPGLAAARHVLHAMGRLPAPPAPPAAAALDRLRHLPLGAADAAIEACLCGLEAATGFGTRLPPPGAAAPWVAERLAGLAVALLRDYTLGLGCRVLRVIGYLGLEHPQRRSGLDFLLLQQRPEGSFGAFGPEESLLPPDYPVATALELPVALDVLWTLREAAGDWRLYRSLGLPGSRIGGATCGRRAAAESCSVG